MYGTKSCWYARCGGRPAVARPLTACAAPAGDDRVPGAKPRQGRHERAALPARRDGGAPSAPAAPPARARCCSERAAAPRQTPETAGEEPVSSADKFAQMMAAKAAGGESDARRPVAFDVYIALSTTEGK